MSLFNKGMLVNFMNIDAADEQDFNQWYDEEHLVERVAIPGFIQAHRYVALNASQKYLATYVTESVNVLNSDAYKKRLANQTPWSLRNIAKFRDVTRACANIFFNEGQGHGAFLAFVRLRPDDNLSKSQVASITRSITPIRAITGIVSVQAIESISSLSVPLTEAGDIAGSSDCYILINGTSRASVENGLETLAPEDWAQTGVHHIFSSCYCLLWGLTKPELECR